MTILVTGGAGFIGSNFVLEWIEEQQEPVVNLDKLTYAGNLGNLDALKNNPLHKFVRGGIEDSDLVKSLLVRDRIRAVVNFAAESHVDRSIHDPEAFINTNIVGTFRLLETVRAFYQTLDAEEKAAFRFLHVSTDEIYGTLGPSDAPFSEENQVKPNSPYAASKASSDHLVRAYFETYSLPVLITNCSNNYGPRHFPEKLIPLIIHRALRRESLPIYGDGRQIRDWLYVSDHCSALRLVLSQGLPGRTYNVGGNNEMANIDVVRLACGLLDELRPRDDALSYFKQVEFVKDRLGHDRRYAIDASRVHNELGWKPRETFESGLRKTVTWYLENQNWVDSVTSGEYARWIDTQY